MQPREQRNHKWITTAVSAIFVFFVFLHPISPSFAGAFLPSNDRMVLCEHNPSFPGSGSLYTPRQFYVTGDPGDGLEVGPIDDVIIIILDSWGSLKGNTLNVAGICQSRNSNSGIHGESIVRHGKK